MLRRARRTTVVRGVILAVVAGGMVCVNTLIRGDYNGVHDYYADYGATAESSNEIGAAGRAAGVKEARGTRPPAVGEPPLPTNRTLVLLWTTLFGQMNPWFDYYGFQFTNEECAHECELTSDGNRLEQADVVMFSAYGVDQAVEPPPYRDPRQIWAFFSQESPVNVERDEASLSTLNGVFNWTVTYRMDSDVRVLYGKIGRRKTPVNDTDFDKVLKSKKRMVAAVISNCLTSSKRERYIQELVDAGIPVDIFGSCGQAVCAPGKAPDECYKLLSADYKFILSFENSICRDYVTEKMFDALRHPWVPVVYGGANYSQHVPPGAVIDASRTPAAELASRLRELDANDTLYLQHLAWRGTHEVLPYYPWGCELCRKAREWKEAEPPRKQTYDDLFGWWVRKSECRNLPFGLSDTMRVFQKLLGALTGFGGGRGR